MYWSDAAWWAWIPMTLMMALLWGVVAWVAIRLLTGSGDDQVKSSRTPRQILDARLASGEIHRDEYEELRAVLEGEHGPQTPSRIGDEVPS
jgi:uncharacterized membrane protein